MEIGQGFKTVMAQIAAEVLQVPPSKIRVESPDTDRNPYEWQTVASHITWSCGNAVMRAAEDAREQICDLIARALEKDRDSLYLDDEKVKTILADGAKKAGAIAQSKMKDIKTNERKQNKSKEPTR